MLCHCGEGSKEGWIIQDGGLREEEVKGGGGFDGWQTRPTAWRREQGRQ